MCYRALIIIIYDDQKDDDYDNEDCRMLHNLPLAVSQSFTVLSIDPVAIKEESQLNWAELISARCPISVCIFLSIIYTLHKYQLNWAELISAR